VLTTTAAKKETVEHLESAVETFKNFNCDQTPQGQHTVKFTMLVTVPACIAILVGSVTVGAGIAGVAVYASAGDADTVTGNQYKKEGGFTVIDAGNISPGTIIMASAIFTASISLTCLLGHKCGFARHARNEEKRRDLALGHAKNALSRAILGPKSKSTEWRNTLKPTMTSKYSGATNTLLPGPLYQGQGHKSLLSTENTAALTLVLRSTTMCHQTNSLSSREIQERLPRQTSQSRRRHTMM
jgi:hypothetical protein